jgi:hypothetical protein
LLPKSREEKPSSVYNNNEDPPPTNEKKDSDTNKSPAKQKVDTKVKVENKEKAKTPPPQVKQEGKQNETGKKNEHVTNKKPDTNVKIVTSKPAGFTCKPKEPEIINEMKSSREIADNTTFSAASCSLASVSASAASFFKLTLVSSFFTFTVSLLLLLF